MTTNELICKIADIIGVSPDSPNFIEMLQIKIKLYEEMKDKLHRRNMQIKRLKNKIADLRNAVVLGLREDQTAGDNR